MRKRQLERLLDRICGKVDTLSKDHEIRTRGPHSAKLSKKMDHMAEVLAATNRKLDHMSDNFSVADNFNTAGDRSSRKSDKNGYQAA